MLSTVATAQTAAPLVCETCDGSGRSGRRDCDDCNGHGHLACMLCPHHEPAVRLAPCGDPVCAACGEQSDRDYAAHLEQERRDQDLEAFGPSTSATRRAMAEEGWS